MTERFEPVFYVRVYPVGAPRNVWHRMDLTDRVESFVYEDDEKKADKLSLTVDNFDLAHFDDPVWKAGNRLVISWGYPGNMAPARTVVIRKVTGFEKLKIEADGLEVLGMREVRTRVFEHMKRSDAVRQVANALGYRTDDVLHVQDTGEVLEQITQMRLTDNEFIRRMAEKEGFEYYVDFDGFHFHEADLTQAPRRVWRWYNASSTPAAGAGVRGEVISINVETDVTAKPARVKVRGRSPKTKQEIEAEQTADAYQGEITAVTLEEVDPNTGERTYVGYSVHVPRVSEAGLDEFNPEGGSGQGGAPVLPPDPSLEPGQPLDPSTPPQGGGTTGGSGSGGGGTGSVGAAAADGEQLYSSAEVGYSEAGGSSGGAPWPASVDSPDDAATFGPRAEFAEPATESDAGGEQPTAVATTLPTSEETETGVARAAAAVYRRVRQVTVKLGMKVEGDPNVLAKTVFELQNAGKRISQYYYIENVKHVIAGSGYTLDIKARSDGAGGAARTSRVAPGLSSIKVRAAKSKRRKKPAAKDPLTPATEDGMLEPDPDNPGQLRMRYARQGEAQRSQVFVAMPGYNSSEVPPEVSDPSNPPPEFVPPTGVGGTGNTRPAPEENPSFGVGGTSGVGSGDESRIGI